MNLSRVVIRRDLKWKLLVTLALGSCAWGEGTAPGGPALTAQIAGGDGQTGTVSTTLLNPVRVLLTINGIPQAGITVVWLAQGTGASTTPDSSLSDSSGVAQANWTLGSTAGTQSLTATIAGAAGSPLTFTATANAGPTPLVAKTATSSGDGQTATVGATLTNPLRVIVTLSGVAQSGVTITWTAVSSGGAMTPNTSQTDASGIATSSWTLGGTIGTQTATAAVGGASGSPVTFTATATAPVGGAVDTVNVQNSLFVPDSIKVTTNTTVAWVWPSGSRNHNIVPVSPATVPDSPTLVDGPFSYSFVFTQAGTYRYFCSQHGTATTGMRGVVVVQ